MRIAYCSTDEVNRLRAEEMASACGLTLCPLDPKDPSSNEAFDAVLVDLDFWPIGEQREVLAELLAGNGASVVAVHGYNVADDQAEALGRQGVAVYRWLRPQLFRFVRRTLRVLRAAQARSAATRTSRPRANQVASLEGNEMARDGSVVFRDGLRSAV
jgi:hypothetical protein